MTGSRWKRIALLLLCIGFSAALTYQVRQRAHGTIVMTDLGELYYGARCAMQHIDPYDPSAVLREFTAAGGRFRSDAVGEEANRIGVTNCINLPTGLFLAIPFALLPWGLAQGLWVVLLAGLLVMAAWLTWDLGGSASPAVWVCLAGFVLANCELALTGGNHGQYCREHLRDCGVVFSQRSLCAGGCCAACRWAGAKTAGRRLCVAVLFVWQVACSANAPCKRWLWPAILGGLRGHLDRTLLTALGAGAAQER